MYNTTIHIHYSPSLWLSFLAAEKSSVTDSNLPAALSLPSRCAGTQVMHVYTFKLKIRTCNLPKHLFIKSYTHLICIQQSATTPSSEDPPCICWREAVSPPSDRRPQRSTLALPILPCLKLGTASPLLATNSARNKLGRYVTSCIHAFMHSYQF